jgi:toxin YoeB
MYSLAYTDEALKDIEALKKSGNRAALEKLETLLTELTEHPKTGIGKPEPLRGNFSGCWSRHITSKHRLVYRIVEQQVVVVILQAYGHYYGR